MRRRRCRHWLLPIALWASLIGRDVAAQKSSLPPAIEEQPAASPLGRQSPLGAASDLFAQAAPPAPQPIPGPAGVGFPVGGMDAVVPEGLPINLATAMQLSGVRPLDIAAAMAQVQQALALQLQAKALWIPNSQRGRRLLPARWCPAKHLHGSEFSERVADILRRRRPQPVRRAHRRDLLPARGAARGRLAAGRPPGRAERCPAHGGPSLFRRPGGAGKTARRRGDDRQGRAARELHQGAGTQSDRTAGDQSGTSRIAEPAAEPADRHPRLAGRKCAPGGGSLA